MPTNILCRHTCLKVVFFIFIFSAASLLKSNMLMHSFLTIYIFLCVGVQLYFKIRFHAREKLGSVFTSQKWCTTFQRPWQNKKKLSKNNSRTLPNYAAYIFFFLSIFSISLGFLSCSFLISYIFSSLRMFFGCNLNINLWCCYITSVLSLSTYCCCFLFHFSFFPLSVFLYFYKSSSSVSSLPELSFP